MLKKDYIRNDGVRNSNGSKQTYSGEHFAKVDHWHHKCGSVRSSRRLAKEDPLDEEDDKRARLEQCTRSAGEALLDHICEEEDVRIRQVPGEALHHAFGVIGKFRGQLRGVCECIRRGGQAGREGDDEKTVDDEEEVVPSVHREGQVRVARDVLEPGERAEEVWEEQEQDGDEEWGEDTLDNALYGGWCIADPGKPVVVHAERVDVGDCTSESNGEGPEDDQADVCGPGEQIAELHFVGTVVNLENIRSGRVRAKTREDGGGGDSR